jgi:NADH dehydrogenase
VAHRIVIIGGGFGGLCAARTLARLGSAASVTLVDRRNHHLFQPLLYQVATGGLSPADISSPLRFTLRHQKNVTTVLGEVTGFHLPSRRVLLADGELEYDSLIVAAGSETSYFGNDVWAPHAPGLKTVEEATEIRSRIFFAFERAEREPDPVKRRAWLTFAVVGAGPTGVELSGTLGEIARDTLRDDFRRIKPEEARILLIDGNERVLSAFPPELSRRAEQDLIRLGVRFRPNCLVIGVTDDSVTIREPDGNTESIPTHTVLWAAGVRASPLGKLLAGQSGAELDRAGRVKVLPDCSLPGHPNVFVAGDLAHFTAPDGKQLPGVAQVAMQMGEYAARRIIAQLHSQPAPPPFRYWDKGNMATIGRATAVADLGRLRFGGWFAWILWLAIHLLYLVEFQNRIQVGIHWAFQYLTFARGARLITGTRRLPDPDPS